MFSRFYQKRIVVPQVTGRRVEAIQATAELVTAAGGEGGYVGDHQLGVSENLDRDEKKGCDYPSQLFVMFQGNIVDNKTIFS